MTVVLLAGCSSGSKTSDGSTAECGQVVNKLLDHVQTYVEQYTTDDSTTQPTPVPTAAPSPDGSDADLDVQRAMQRARKDLQEQGCDLSRFRDDFRKGVGAVKAHGALAQAVLLRLTASVTGELGRIPETVRLGPHDDLPRAIARLAPGSTVRLAEGSYRLDQELVLLAGVTVRGAGAGRTRVLSSAAGSALVVIASERVELRDLAMLHQGGSVASVVVSGPSSHLVLTGVRVGGGTTHGKQGGGSGIVMTSGPEPVRGTETTLEVTDSVFADNDIAGMLLTGGHRVSIRRSRFKDNGQCGVCFSGVSSGAVRDSRFSDNAVGVAVIDDARPLLDHDTFAGGKVGVQASDRAAPVIRHSRVTSVERAALIFSDHTAGRVGDVKCPGVLFGILVLDKALPYLGNNDCRPVRGP